MSWWNDLSTHRNAASGSHDGAPRQPTSTNTAAAARFSPYERRPVSPEHHACAPSTISGSFSFTLNAGTEEATWGTSATHSDLASLWQTSGSAGISEQPATFENSPLWGPQKPSSSASPPPRGVDAFVTSPSLSGKGMLGELVHPRSTGGSYAESAAVLSSAANGVSVVNVRTATTPVYTSVAEQGSHRTVVEYDRRSNEDTNGNDEEVEDDDVSLYDVDLGTISSLIASLQGRSAKIDGEDAGGVAATALPGSQEGRLQQRVTPLPTPNAAAPSTITTTAASATPPTIVVDAAGTSASGEPRLLARFSDPMWGPAGTAQRHPRSSSGSLDPSLHQHRAACNPGLVESDAAAIAPLHLTPSMLDGILASFQTALKGRSGEGAVGFSPTPRVSNADLPHPDRYGNSGGGADTQEGRGFASSVNSTTQGATPHVSRGSPLMRGHVSSVVAHKLNIDGNPRGTPVQDFRRGVTAASNGSSCSDPSTPVRQRGASVPGRLPPSHQHHHQQQQLHERAASPDSSIDQFFSLTTPAVTSFAAVRPFASSSTVDDRAAMQLHRRTESDVSLPVAASTYNGSSAMHQRVDERGCITVVDPQRRKLHVPLSAIQTTKALNGRLKAPSLCLLFQSGRCRQGDNCYQVHVDPATVDRLRVDVESMPCCCLLHGDCNSHLADPALYERRSLLISGQFNVPLSRVAYTSGLQRVLQEETTSVPVNPSVLCRLHGERGGCRFGADCKFVHVCCGILHNELVTVMSSAAIAAAAASTHSQPAQLDAQMQQHQQQQQQHPLPRLASSAPDSPSTFVHSHTSSTTGATGSAVNLPLPTALQQPSATVPRQMLPLPLPANNSVIMAPSGEPTLSPPFLMQAGQVLAPNGSPTSMELRLSNSGAPPQQMSAPNGGGGAALYNCNYDATPRQNDFHNRSSSLVTSANFSPVQMAQGMSAGFSNRGNAPMAFTNGIPLTSQQPGPLFTVTTVQQPRPAQTAAATLVPNSPHSGYHMRTLSTQSNNGGHALYPASTLVATPNRSGAGSPVSTCLAAARSMLNLCSSQGSFASAPRGGRTSGFASPMQRQLPQQFTPPRQHQQQHSHQHSTSQQFYMQQVNQDGSVSFVPFNMVQSIGG